MYNNKRTCIHVILITTTANKCFPAKCELHVHVDIYFEHMHVINYFLQVFNIYLQTV